MNSPTQNDILEGLRTERVQPSLAAHVRAKFVAIKECLAAGYSHRKIHDWLTCRGMQANYKVYHRAFRRLELQVESAGAWPSAQQLPSAKGEKVLINRKQSIFVQDSLPTLPPEPTIIGTASSTVRLTEAEHPTQLSSRDAQSINVEPSKKTGKFEYNINAPIRW